MTKLIKTSVAVLALAVSFTSCTQEETPTPTPTVSIELSKDSISLDNTIDVRDIAAGTFKDNTSTSFAPQVDFVIGNTIDKMFIYERGMLTDSITIEGTAFGFAFVGSQTRDLKIDGFYTVDTDTWNLRVGTLHETFNWNLKRVK